MLNLKKYLLGGIAALGLLATLGFLYKATLDDAYDAGYNAKVAELQEQLQEMKEEKKALEKSNFQTANRHLDKIYDLQDKLKEARRQANDTPEIQKTHSVCNLVRSDVSLLNASFGYSIGSPDNPGLADNQGGEDSTITEQVLIQKTVKIGERYENLRVTYLDLLDVLDSYGLIPEQTGSGPGTGQREVQRQSEVAGEGRSGRLPGIRAAWAGNPGVGRSGDRI